MATNDIDKRLDELSSLQKQEAPPFLWTRIEARIASAEVSKPGKVMVWTLTVGVVLIMFLNTFVILSGAGSQEATVAVAEEFGLVTSNQIYSTHE